MGGHHEHEAFPVAAEAKSEIVKPRPLRTVVPARIVRQRHALPNLLTRCRHWREQPRRRRKLANASHAIQRRTAGLPRHFRLGDMLPGESVLPWQTSPQILNFYR
jgi:uncharacterized protein YjiS (DUF1127 family)